MGREREIDHLVQALSKAATSGAAAAISGVRGMGGIGKTELAYVVANRIKDVFPDAKILVELRGASSSPLSPEQALKMVISSLEREAKLPDDADQLKGLYNSALAGKRVLILADDAHDVAQVRSLMPPLGCALLVTSRNRFSLPGMQTVDLEVLSPQEAEKLLLEKCPRIGEHTGELAQLCGYLPLALQVSAGLLKDNDNREVGLYLEQLRAERLKHLSDLDNPNDPQASVEASLRLSYEALEPTAQNVLCQMSVFPSSYDLEALKAVVWKSSMGLLPRMMRWLRHQTIEELPRPEDLLDTLRRRSLLEWDALLERYSLHDLVRAFAVTRLKDADEMRLRHARHFVGVAAYAQFDLFLKGNALAGLALFERERVQIDAGQCIIAS